MDVDEHLLWLLSALKLATSKGSDEVNRDKLIQNVNNCFLRVKKERKSGSVPTSEAAEELLDFQAKASLLLLLCLPEIRELQSVENCQDFQSLLSSLPELSDSIFFNVVRAQKIYFLLSPLLSWLPSSVVETLTKQYFHHTHQVTPVTLTISVELLKSLLFSQQYRHTLQADPNDSTECLELLVKFLSSKNVSGETPSMTKFSGYFFMYIFECLHLLLAAYVGCKIKEPDTLPCVETWTKLWKTNNSSTEAVSLPYTKEALVAMVTLCQNNSREITVNIWMEWSEQKLPQNTTYCSTSPTHQTGKAQAKSIQMATCNIAFHIRRLLEAHVELEEDLATREYHELLQFLEQTALDPDYDPDEDLTLEQLIEEINVKDDRQGKLLGLLVQREGVIGSSDACTCLKEHSLMLDTQMKIDLLQNCIEWLKASKPHIPESINVVVELAADLSPDQLKPIIEDRLSAGLDDVLKTSSFSTHLTSVFNQLADENTAQPSGRHVWLCLQCGVDVVQQAVRLAVTMTGLVPVMVQTLADLPQVSRAKLPSGNSLLASTLVEWQTSQLCDREEQEFIVLVKHLLSVKGLLDGKEVLELMVEPFLVMQDSRNLGKLILPLELLKEVMEQDVGVVVRCGPEVVSVVVGVMQVMDATVRLEGHGASRSLTIRGLASTILFGITNVMATNRKKYEKEITLLKQMVSQHSLHPWSVMQVSSLLQAELSPDSSVDVLLQALMKASPDPPHTDPLDPVIRATLDSAGLKKMSKSEWIITLLKLLPHCSEREWISAFFITDYVLAAQNTVFPVLEVFQEALQLLCESLVTPAHQETHTPPPPPPPPPVSLHHCFTFFTSASMIYLEGKFQTQTSREKFLNLADIFVWWCCSVPSFHCNPELPSVFLARLCAALEEIIVSGRLKVLAEEHSGPGSVRAPASEGVGVRETESQHKDYTNDINGESSEKQEKQHKEKDICNEEKKNSNVLGIYIKKEIEKIVFFMVQYVPFSNLLASIASKLKKLYEM